MSYSTMSYSIWGTIAETPWWLYLFFLGILNIVWRSTKTQNINMTFSLIMPWIVNGIFIFALAASIRFDLHKLTPMLYPLIPGIFLGWLQFRLRCIKAIKSQSQFHIPGSWSLLIILFALITAKMYYFGYGFNINLNTFTQDNTISIIILLCGLITGLSIGKTYYLYRCMKYGPFLEKN